MSVYGWAAAAVLGIYTPLAMMPAEWLWYDPGRPTFADTVEGQPVQVFFSRNIKRSSMIQYATTVRDAERGDPVCDGNGGPFRYKAQEGDVIDHDLHWWTGNDCPAYLPPSHYYVETTWTVVQPLGDLMPDGMRHLFGWILPAKTVERSSPVFKITAKE